MKSIATAFFGLILASGACAQSTDPEHPSPWTSLGVNGLEGARMDRELESGVINPREVNCARWLVFLWFQTE